MKFNEMIYTRPDLNDIKERIIAQTQLIKGAKTFQEAESAFLTIDKIQRQVNTADSLSYIRYEIDTTDKFYQGELQFFDEHLPELQNVQQDFSYALLASPFKAALSEKYGEIYFKNTELDVLAFSPEIIPNIQRTNILKTHYNSILASAQIPFNGKVYTLSQLAPHKHSTDDDMRRAAWVAEGNFYNSHSDNLDSIFDNLVLLRHESAVRLGYENFIPLGYYRMRRGNYGPKDVEEFRKSIVKYIVPLAKSIMERQAVRTGLPYPFSFSDCDLAFRDGNPHPVCDTGSLLSNAYDMYHELSPETGEFIDFMFDNDLMDVLSKKGKSSGGFCASIPEYESPFIFANFNGSSNDVEVMTHEAGHAFNYYMGRKQVPLENSQPTLEACEIHSMAMEFLAWPWSDKFFGDDGDKFHYTHLTGAITFLPYGAMVDDFQHRIYAQPHLSPQARHNIWQELLTIYMPWIDSDDMPFYGEGKGWQRQMHIYQNPFYYVDYCIAQAVALEIWSISLEDKAAAWEKYISYTKLSGTLDFLGLLSASGLGSPFSARSIKSIANSAKKWLENSPFY